MTQGQGLQDALELVEQQTRVIRKQRDEIEELHRQLDQQKEQADKLTAMYLTVDSAAQFWFELYRDRFGAVIDEEE